jgi:hypothetical protein
MTFFGMDLVDRALMLSPLPYPRLAHAGHCPTRKLVYGEYLILYTIDEAGTLPRSGQLRNKPL